MAGQRKSGAGANVRIYDAKLGGLAYVLKFINEPLGDWDFGNLDLFLSPLDRQETDSRQRRRLARHVKRTQLAATFTLEPFSLPGRNDEKIS
jgi:hypothetical protein